jgi:hypothetical protein
MCEVVIFVAGFSLGFLTALCEMRRIVQKRMAEKE